MKIILAGTGSAVGKTTISTGIMKALSKHRVQPFKVGPDYIDPSYHTIATGNISRNLDSFFMNDQQIVATYNRTMKNSKAKYGIIEGVRGLYEGISPITDVGSTASIAKTLNAPIVLIIDSCSLVKSAAAIVLGFKSLDMELKIDGVILNKVKGKKHYLKTKESVETLTNTKVIGGIPRDDKVAIEQRHLGLVPALEKEKITKNIEIWGKMVEEYLDLDALIDIMKGFKTPKAKEELWRTGNKKRVKIGLARDEAFNFYYQDNIDALKENNAEVIQFSPLHDENLPDVDGLYIGGGYPEVFKNELEKNSSIRESILKFHKDGNHIYGECGGLIYLSKSIDKAKMCGVIPFNSVMTPRVQGLSYTIIKSKKNNLISKKDEIFKGHEFHYTELNDVSGNFAFEVQRGRGIINGHDGLTYNNTLANYIHIHSCSCPNFAYNFTKNIAEDINLDYRHEV
ncbi:MAG: Ni-sirohydrochlorin a,c-diamide synthase [Methanobrevibacter sp.]|jgi:cobyrinic acid a,c-diamide synthase|nr:Ni-sirohydrochlorin a,c-diamide synthase [Candidatus Methanovirga aequatorialis]